MSEEVISLPKLRTCRRCERHDLLRRSLCGSCFQMFNRLLRKKYGDSEAFTPEMYIQLHPLQTHRRKEPSRITEEVKQIVPGFLVCSPIMEKIAALVRRVALTDLPVIVEGETGVGKEGIVRAIHRYSARNKKPFIPVNCASISESLAESELFGHERGSFTGSQRHTDGLFRSAHLGTLFLDEIETLLYTIQGKLLRVLESGEVRPVGSIKNQIVDVRVVVATNQNLVELCNQRAFRQDLLYRLNGIMISIPPLRERREEIPILSRFILSQTNQPQLVIEDPVMEVLMNYSWPGNVRQLKNVLAQACLHTESKSQRIKMDYIPREIRAVPIVQKFRSAR